MTVKELREKLEELPEYCDDYPVVSLQAELENHFKGSIDELRFMGFEDIELKRVNVEDGKVRIN